MSIRGGKLIYHLVPLNSLESIFTWGLMSRDDLDRYNIRFIDTADHAILFERERLGLSQYIPFHFHIHTAYDTAVKHNNSELEFIYICLHRDYAKRMNYKVLPLHPASNEQPILYDYAEGFSNIDWDTMEMTIPQAQKAGKDLRYHRQVRMAECLAFSPIPVSCFQSIIVPDDETKTKIYDLFDSFNTHDRPFVDVENWFV